MASADAWHLEVPHSLHILGFDVALQLGHAYQVCIHLPRFLPFPAFPPRARLPTLVRVTLRGPGPMHVCACACRTERLSVGLREWGAEREGEGEEWGGERE